MLKDLIKKYKVSVEELATLKHALVVSLPGLRNDC